VGRFYISVLHTAHKLRSHATPRMAALGNMPSSSSAMCISPVGIVNACNPRAAAAQAYGLAGLIHTHDVGFCQDAAASMAAAVAAAFLPGATVETVLDAAMDAILPLSGQEMRGRIEAALALAREAGEYGAFREALYAQGERFFCRITCDSRETVPLTLALWWLGQGDVADCIIYAANLGRDADTIASMVGAMAGALRGAASIQADWVDKVRRVAAVDQEALAEDLARVALAKRDEARAAAARLDVIA
jgi:ADP-ribosylglycohydrolase